MKIIGKYSIINEHPVPQQMARNAKQNSTRRRERMKLKLIALRLVNATLCARNRNSYLSEEVAMNGKHHETCLVIPISVLFPATAFAFGGADKELSMAMFTGFFLFSVIGIFVAVTFNAGARAGAQAGAQAGAMMLLFWSIILVIVGIQEGGIRVEMTGIPLELAIGVVSSIIAGIILILIQGR